MCGGGGHAGAPELAAPLVVAFQNSSSEGSRPLTQREMALLLESCAEPRDNW